jgi:hypothetical protein
MRPRYWSYTIPLRLHSLFRRREPDRELADRFNLQRWVGLWKSHKWAVSTTATNAMPPE